MIEYTGERNLLKWSERFDFSPWTTAASPTIEGGHASPDGGDNASLLTGTSTSSRVIQSGIALTTGEVVSASVHLKYVDQDIIYFRLWSGSGDIFLCRYRFSTNSFTTNGGSGTNRTLTSEDVGDGWIRVKVTATAHADASYQLLLYPADGAAEGTYGDVLAWGAQLERDAVTAYEKTEYTRTDTIKPAGGGDYYTLAAWESAVQGLAPGTYIAEGYTGNAGGVTLSGWSSPADKTVIIRAAAGHESTGFGTGFHIDSAASGINMSATAPQTIRIKGMAVNCTNESVTYSAISGYMDWSHDIEIENVWARTARGQGIYLGGSTLGNTSRISLKNCIGIGGTVGGQGIRLLTGSAGEGNVFVDWSVINCVGHSRASGNQAIYITSPAAAEGDTRSLINCIGIGYTGAAALSAGALGDATQTEHSNISSDATANGANSQKGVNPDDLFIDYASGDYRLKKGSPAINAGDKTIAPTHDITGQRRDAAPDIGAYEYVPPLKPVLTTLWTFGGAGSGPRIHAIADQIDAAMAANGSPYTLTKADLGGYAEVNAE